MGSGGPRSAPVGFGGLRLFHGTPVGSGGLRWFQEAPVSSGGLRWDPMGSSKLRWALRYSAPLHVRSESHVYSGACHGA